MVFNDWKAKSGKIAKVQLAVAQIGIMPFVRVTYHLIFCCCLYLDLAKFSPKKSRTCICVISSWTEFRLLCPMQLITITANSVVLAIIAPGANLRINVKTFSINLREKTSILALHKTRGCWPRLRGLHIHFLAEE